MVKRNAEVKHRDVCNLFSSGLAKKRICFYIMFYVHTQREKETEKTSVAKY